MIKILLKIFPAILTFILPGKVFAQDGNQLQSACNADDTFGKIVNSAIGNTGSELISTIYVVSALIGVVGVGMGIKALISSASDSRSNPVGNGLLKIFAGSLLISFPAMMVIIGTTFFNEQARTEGFTGPVPQGYIASDQCSPANNMMEMYTNFVVDAADPLTKLAYFGALVIGIFLILTAVQRMMDSANPNSAHNGKYGEHLLRLAVGGLFVNLMPLITVLSETLFFGQSSYRRIDINGEKGVLTYVPEGGNSSGLQYFCNINDYIFIGLIPFGLFAVIAGLRSIYMSIDGKQQSSIGGGAVKIVAGIILVNMKVFSIAVINTIAPSADLIAQSCGG